MIYTKNLKDITINQLEGFFVGWPNPPSNKSFLDLLKGSHFAYVAIENSNVVGFVSVISDGVLSAYIPLLEVLPDYQGRGIGSTLLRKSLEDLKNLYMIDLSCDIEKVSYYKQFGFYESTNMMIRNYDNQNGVITL